MKSARTACCSGVRSLDGADVVVLEDVEIVVDNMDVELDIEDVVAAVPPSPPQAVLPKIATANNNAAAR